MPGERPAGDPLAQLIAGRYPDPDGGAPLGATVRAIAIEDTLRDREVELIVGLGLGPRLTVIGDDHTLGALGARVAGALTGRFLVETISLGRDVHPDAATVRRLIGRVDPRSDAVIAVGSGTINDLTKMVALARGCPQVTFPTAPSMNGYTSVSASIVEDGLKRSIRAAAPVGVFVDLEVLAAAPAPLIRAGLGDSICRPTAQADWLLAHLLLDPGAREPYRAAPFALLAADEAALFAAPEALLAGDLGAMRHLARTLLLSGCGMTICGGSFPASQGEHLLSHYAELRGAAAPTPRFHGEQIGVTALVMAELQRELIDSDQPPVLAPTALDRAEVLRHFAPFAPPGQGVDLGEACWREFAPKRLDEARAEELSGRLAVAWDPLRARLGAVMMAPAVMRDVLRRAGAVTTTGELGWSSTLLGDGLRFARAIRNRYTFLDLAGDVAG